MITWTELLDIPVAARVHFTRIWRSDDGDYQINLSTDGEFLLLDARQPVEVPASSTLGYYSSLDDAKAKAEELGPNLTWKDWETYWED